MAPSLSLDLEEPVSESVQENFDVEQLREEPEVHSKVLFRHIQAHTTVSYGGFVLVSTNTLHCTFVVCFRQQCNKQETGLEDWSIHFSIS
jgi:hypothetical protein